MAEPDPDDLQATRPHSGERAGTKPASGTDPTLLASGTDPTRVVSAAGSGAPAGLPQIPDLAIEGELGRGGMGVVYRGRQTYIDRPVAVKVLELRGGAQSEEFLRRFQREAKLLARFDHPHIVKCYQAGLTPAGCPYLVMEFVDGCTLRQQIEQDGPLDQRSVLLLARDLARALMHAHEQGIIHRDVKPENVLLQHGSSAIDSALPYVVKLADLGLARPGHGSASSETSALTAQGMIMGTPATMAPEQFDDPDALDFRCDIYGLGCVLHHALTGKPAFTGKTFNQLLKNKISAAIPDTAGASACCSSVARLVASCLAPDREQRPASYQVLIASIDQALQGLEGQATGRARRRVPLPAALGLGLGLLLLTGLGIVQFARSDPVVADSAPEPPAAPPASPQSLPPAAPALPAENLEQLPFGEPQPLWNEDFGERLAEWTAEPRGAWASHDEHPDAIFGTAFGPRGSASLRRPMPVPPWRLDCRLLPMVGEDLPPLREAGLWLVDADGRSVGVAVQHLITAHYLALRERDAANEPARTIGKTIPVTDLAAGIPLRITAGRDRIRVETAGRLIGELSASGITALEIRVEGGGIELIGLRAAYPLP